MLAIPLTAVPNQSVSFNVDGAYWTVHIYQSIAFMCADITKNGVPIANGVRCFGGFGLMQYSYMSNPNFGNFVFDQDADWNNFETTCNLYYLEQAEYAQFQQAMLTGATS